MTFEESISIDYHALLVMLVQGTDGIEAHVDGVIQVCFGRAKDDVSLDE